MRGKVTSLDLDLDDDVRNELSGRVLSLEVGGRLVVEALPSTGKTSIMRKILGYRFGVEQPESRCLVVAHPAVLAEWYPELQEIEAIAFASPSQLTDPSFAGELRGERWDLVVIDEPSLMEHAALEVVLRELWLSPLVEGAVVLESMAPAAPEPFRSTADLVQWTVEGMLWWEMFQELEVKLVHLSEEEASFQQQLHEVIGRNAPEEGLEVFGLSELILRATSSLWSVGRLLGTVPGGEWGPFGWRVGTGFEAPVVDLTGLGDQELRRLGRMLERVKFDSKLEGLDELVQTHGSEGLVVVSDIEDTAQYLGAMGEDRWGMRRVSAGMSLESRREAVSSGGIAVLGPGALAGVSLAGAGTVVHYDVPSDQMVARDRFARASGTERQVFINDCGPFSTEVGLQLWKDAWDTDD